MSEIKSMLSAESYEAKMRVARGTAIFGMPLASLDKDDLLVAFVLNQEIMQARLDGAQRLNSFHADLLKARP